MSHLPSQSENGKHLILLGTHEFHTHSVIFDEQARTLTRGVSTPTPEQPSWLIRHPKYADLLYGNSWVENKVFLYRLKDDQGTLEVLDEALTGGEGPTHMALLPGHKELVVAHYRSGSVSVVPLQPSGHFAVRSVPASRHYSAQYPSVPFKHYRQEAPHVHQVVLHDDEILTPDLGSNVVWRWKWDDKEERLELLGKVSGLQDGDGPRHLVVHPSGTHLYVLNEVSSTLSIHTLPKRDAASPSSELVERITLLPPTDDGTIPKPTGAAELILLPSVSAGRDGQTPPRMLLIGSNRDSPDPQDDTLALFSVSPTDGADVKRTQEGWIGGVGKHLRAVEQDAGGRYVLVAARDTGRLVMFERAGEDGLRLEEVARIEGFKQVVVPVWI
ncbi:hypothetical protein IAU60_000640 [Kwoniella sp. DSM 27419]